jgi:streptogramin lyase
MIRSGERKRAFSRARAALLAVLALAVMCSYPGRAAATSASVSEWELAPTELHAGPIVAGPDGNLWLGVTRLVGSEVTGAPRFEGHIDRTTTDGDVTELPGTPGVSALAAGPDGNVWYLSSGEVGYVSPGGQLTRFSLPQPFGGGGLALGSDGNMWTAERNDSAGDTIVRISPTGELTRFPLPQREVGPAAITAGPDGALWFTETFSPRIGRITTSGRITEFPVPSPVDGITAGPDGNVWLAAGLIGRLTPKGDLKTYGLGGKQQAWGPIAAGPDGRIWFSDGPGSIGRISPSGRITHVSLPDRGWTVNSLTAGPDGAVWFSAPGSETCEGGGLTCMNWIPKRTAKFGRIVPGSLEVSIGSNRGNVSRHRAAIRLRCAEGHASDVCRGRIVLKAGRSAGLGLLGRRHYALPTDSSHTFLVRMRPVALERLRRVRHLRATATVTLAGGKTASRGITLVPVKSPSAR